MGPGALLSHTKPCCSLAFLSSLKERMLKRLCTKETPLQNGEEALSLWACVWGRERSARGHPNALSEGCLGNPGKGVSTAGTEIFSSRSRARMPDNGTRPLGSSSHYTALNHLHLFGDEELLLTIYSKVQSLWNLVAKCNYGKRWTYFFLKQSLEKGGKNSCDIP